MSDKLIKLGNEYLQLEGFDKYDKELEIIKEYLRLKGVDCDYVTMWQGGWPNEGKQYGLDIVARIEVNGVEASYYVPKIKHIITPREFKDFMKL